MNFNEELKNKFKKDSLKESNVEKLEEVNKDVNEDVKNEIKEIIKEENEIIEKIKVHQPNKDIKNTKSLIFYKIEYFTEKETFETKRSFEDFECLRIKLLQFFPGIYIPITHDKINNTRPDFIKERTRSLNKFINYIGEREFLLESELVNLFLKSSINDISKAFEGFKRPDLKSVIKIYQKLTNQVDDIEIENYDVEINFKQIEEFKFIFERNLKVFRMINDNIKDYEYKIREKKINENYIDLLELIINIELKNIDKNKSKIIKEELIKLSENDEARYFRIFQRKFVFMIFDFEAFQETFTNIEKIKNYYYKIKKKEIDLSNNMHKIANKEKRASINEKNEFELKMNEISKDISNIEELQFTLKKLLYFIINRLYNNEIPILRVNKKERYNSAFEYFKNKRVKSLESEINL